MISFRTTDQGETRGFTLFACRIFSSSAQPKALVASGDYHVLIVSNI